jgi:hypothetical protein
MHSPKKRTLIFCTSYAESIPAWDERWGRWLRAVMGSGVCYETILIVDDGSPAWPSWNDFTVTSAENPTGTQGHRIHHFANRLGREIGSDMPFPGWYRSFAHAVSWGIQGDYDRIIHIESDAFLVSDRAVEFFNIYHTGWAALWCRKHGFPESALQIINRDQFRACQDFFSRPYSAHIDSSKTAIEHLLPFTYVNRELIGDRYGEGARPVPADTDYAAQIPWLQPRDYYWWLADDGSRQKLEQQFEDRARSSAGDSQV